MLSLVSYPDPNVRNDDHRYSMTSLISYDHRYVHLGLGTRLRNLTPCIPLTHSPWSMGSLISSTNATSLQTLEVTGKKRVESFNN